MHSDAAPRLRARDPRRFRILQVTDLHTDACEEATQRTFHDLAAAVRQAAPDLLAVTGDIWCSDDRPDLAPILMQRDIAFLADLRTPWAFTPGNHDCIPDSARALREIAATPGAVVDPARPLGAFRVAVCAPDGSARWDLYFANSGEAWRLPGDLDWVAAEARALAEARGAALPSALFFHIPTRAYQEAIDAAGAVGLIGEAVLCSGDEAGAAAALIADIPGLRACFCGHSHRNDFHFHRDGIRHGYGRVGGHGGYGAEDTPRGATRIDLALDGGALDVETLIFP